MRRCRRQCYAALPGVCRIMPSGPRFKHPDFFWTHNVAKSAKAAGTAGHLLTLTVLVPARSLLDLDALIVAKRSLGPILFIALHVEGKRGKRVALLIGVAALVAAGGVALKRRGHDFTYPGTAGVLFRRALGGLSR